MVKDHIKKRAIQNEITDLLNAYIQRRNLHKDLTEISKRLRAAVDSGNKSSINTIKKRHKELYNQLIRLSTKNSKNRLYRQYPIPEDLRPEKGVGVRQSTDTRRDLFKEDTVYLTDLGYFVNRENVSGQSKAHGSSELILDNSVVMLDAWLTDDATPDPFPHFSEDSFSVTHCLEYSFPAQPVDSRLVWRFETFSHSNFLQAAYSGNESLNLGTFGFPTGRYQILDGFIIGPIVNLASSSESNEEIFSGHRALRSTMNVSAGRSAKLWLCVSLNLRAKFGTVSSRNYIHINDGCEGYGGVRYYFI